MRGNGARGRRGGLLIAAALLLGACAGHHQPDADDSANGGLNAYPTNYKNDVLGAVHAYLKDPTGIRDAALSEPILKTVERQTRYVACVRFTPKQSTNANAGTKELAAIFLGGRFDRFVETAREACEGVTYAPFPELEKLSR
jgi:hypothetical protein